MFQYQDIYCSKRDFFFFGGGGFVEPPKCSLSHTLYPGCNIFVYIADQKQPNTSRARMDCGKLTLFLLLQTLKRGVASQGFAEKHSVPTFMFRHK